MRRPSWLMWLTAALLAVPAVPVIAICSEVPPPCCAGWMDECPMPEACTIESTADHPPGAIPSQVVPTPPVAAPAMFTGPDGASSLPRVPQTAVSGSDCGMPCSPSQCPAGCADCK